ncbi:MAG TPA: tetratricopeptide repeat protein [Candidatus Binataceae bacterium]|nr:tetratricopeptide repeat protein [Candidatus Binataceae bacterium]
MTPTRMLAVLAIVFALPVLASPAHGSNDTRARSDEIVKQAEANIMEAGKTNPVDSQLVQRAIDQLHQAAKIDPKNDSAYVDLGFCYALMRDASTAEEMYITATTINPSPANFKELADIYLRTGKAEPALMAANAGLAKDAHNAKLLNAKGLALTDLQRPDEAEAAFREAITYDPNLTVARRNLDALSAAPGKKHSE